jgi:carboxyl-terminal processing protease
MALSRKHLLTIKLFLRQAQPEPHKRGQEQIKRKKRMRRSLLLGALVTMAAGVLTLRLVAQSSERISSADRVMIASKIYHQVSTFFPYLSQKSFDQNFAEYLGHVLNASDDRRDFDLASMALVATLHDGHTWFNDDWLDQTYGQPVGFVAYPLHDGWVVMHTRLESVKVGDVVIAIDGTPTQEYFEHSRQYISASSDRDAGSSLFDTPVLFPRRFTLTLDGNRKVTIDRASDRKQKPPVRTEGRWLTPGSIGYIKVPTFQDIEIQTAALQYLRQFHEAKTIVLDVRGNPGNGAALLQQSLMDKRYPLWTESSSMNSGLLLREHTAYPEVSHVTTGEAMMRPRNPTYTGRLILLIDRGCTCACEDFVMPFKMTKRAQLVGETTAGTFSMTNFTQFDNGMILNIASIRHVFPDGSRFEGVGVAPDVEIQPTAEDLKAGRDVVLDKAVEIATQD